MRVRREVVAALTAIALTACGAAAAGSPDATDTVLSGTVGGVGVLPPRVTVDVSAAPGSVLAPDPTDAVADDEEGEDDSPSSSITTTTRPRVTTTTVEPAAPPIGDLTFGNRVLMIGDSILASTSRRYGNNMCRALVPLGWKVEVEAEVSREISFGNRVLASRMSAGWDAAVVLLGNNYGGKPDLFMRELNRILSTLAPRPVLLLTVTEFEPIQAEVNEIIRAVGALYENVTVVDWATVSNFNGVLSADGLHLTDDGREFLAQFLAPLFGTSPIPEGGECLASKFHDDSAGSVDGPPTTSGGKPPSTTARPTGTTVRPGSTTTTVRPTGTTTPSTTGSTSPSQTTTPQTSPPQTSPPPTSPPQTSPPQTSPPQTSPPQTAPPVVTLPPVTVPPPSETDPPGGGGRGGGGGGSGGGSGEGG